MIIIVGPWGTLLLWGQCCTKSLCTIAILRDQPLLQAQSASGLIDGEGSWAPGEGGLTALSTSTWQGRSIADQSLSRTWVLPFYPDITGARDLSSLLVQERQALYRGTAHRELHYSFHHSHPLPCSSPSPFNPPPSPAGSFLPNFHALHFSLCLSLLLTPNSHLTSPGQLLKLSNCPCPYPIFFTLLTTARARFSNVNLLISFSGLKSSNGLPLFSS